MVSEPLWHARCFSRYVHHVFSLHFHNDPRIDPLCYFSGRHHPLSLQKKKNQSHCHNLLCSNGFGLFAEYNIPFFGVDGSGSFGLRQQCQNMSAPKRVWGITLNINDFCHIFYSIHIFYHILTLALQYGLLTLCIFIFPVFLIIGGIFLIVWGKVVLSLKLWLFLY